MSGGARRPERSDSNGSIRSPRNRASLRRRSHRSGETAPGALACAASGSLRGGGAAERRLTLAKAIEVNEAWRRCAIPSRGPRRSSRSQGLPLGSRTSRRQARRSSWRRWIGAKRSPMRRPSETSRRSTTWPERSMRGGARSKRSSVPGSLAGADLHGLVSLLGELRFHRRLSGRGLRDRGRARRGRRRAGLTG